MKYLFYRVDLGNLPEKATELPEEYECVFWKPSMLSIVPPGVPILPFGIWWTMHELGIFANRHYSLFLVYDGRELVHRSCVFPGYFRFPFMRKTDLQIGDTWTQPRHRGRGLATFALRRTVELCAEPERRIWYVVAENNYASIRVAEKAGFSLVGEGIRTRRLGVSLFGSYVIQSSRME